MFSSKQQEQDTLQTLTAKDSKKLNRSKLFIVHNSNKMGSNRNNHAKISRSKLLERKKLKRGKLTVTVRERERERERLRGLGVFVRDESE